MSRAGRPLRALVASRLALPLVLASSLTLVYACAENLPSGPNTFSATLSFVGLSDTLVVADSRAAQVHATDAAGHVIQGLSFTWTVSDTTIATLATPDTSAGRARAILAKHGGLSRVTIHLADPRFSVQDIVKQLTVVLGGVRIASSHDTTLASINDTAVATGAGLVKSGNGYAPAAAQGIRWTHKGSATTGTGQGDSLRYVAKANGVDTLIASADFCLAGAHCADTAYVRVTQSVKLALSAHSFNAWSINDSVGPTITLTDKRGNGLAGASIHFVPVAHADSLIVTVSTPVGTTNTATGQVASPLLVAAGNGSARARVLALRSDGTTADMDSVTAVVRQVARRVTVDPLLAYITEVDSIPIKPNARDARGNMIGDATLAPTSTLVTFSNGRVIGVPMGAPYLGTLSATLTGVADPANNPTAPQIPYTTDVASVTVVVADSAKVDTTARAFPVTVLSAPGIPAVGQWVRFFSTGGVVSDSAQTDVNGQVIGTWVAPDTAQRWTFSAILAGRPAPVTAADSAGLLLLRRSVFVKAGTPLATTSTASMPLSVKAGMTATITVTVRDKYANVDSLATPPPPSPVTVTSALSATIDGLTCGGGVCTFTYHAPGVPSPPTDTVTVFINLVALPALAFIVTVTP